MITTACKWLQDIRMLQQAHERLPAISDPGGADQRLPSENWWRGSTETREHA